MGVQVSSALLKMISIDELKKWISEYKFGRYIDTNEFLAHLERVAERSLEEKLTQNKRAELNEKKKERLHKELKNA